MHALSYKRLAASGYPGKLESYLNNSLSLIKLLSCEESANIDGNIICCARSNITCREGLESMHTF
jgi:hypothetical protein